MAGALSPCNDIACACMCQAAKESCEGEGGAPWEDESPDVSGIRLLLATSPPPALVQAAPLLERGQPRGEHLLINGWGPVSNLTALKPDSELPHDRTCEIPAYWSGDRSYMLGIPWLLGTASL